MPEPVEPPPIDDRLVDTAVEIARAAGELTLRWFRTDLPVETKADGSPVTEADRAAEELIRSELSANFPGDAILGEEHGASAGTTGRTWTIDPIDGTRSFTRGVAMYTTLLALIDEHGPAVGVAYSPGSDELVAAGRGRGCTLNGQPCQVSGQSDLVDAYLTTSGYDYWPTDALLAVADAGCNLRTWGDGYGYILLASGRVDVMVDPGLHPWDVAPMNVIVPESGGRLTDWSDHPLPSEGDVVATNGRLHRSVLAVLGSEPDQ